MTYDNGLPISKAFTFFFAGGTRAFGESCANEDTHPWLCRRVLISVTTDMSPTGDLLVTQHITGTVSNEATSDMGYPAWPAGRTCNFSSKV